MKAQFGNNQKWVVRPAHREALRAVFTKALGAAALSPPPGGGAPAAPAMEVFELADGCHVGVEFDPEALDEAQARKGTWLEFLVEDPESTARALDALKVRRVAYTDESHAYFQAPGGPVFRLARSCP